MLTITRKLEFDAGQNVLDQVKEVVNLFFGANYRLAWVGEDVCGADQDAALDRIDQHDSPVAVFEEQFATR